MSTDPQPCNEGALAESAAAVQQVLNPEMWMPGIWDRTQCGGPGAPRAFPERHKPAGVNDANALRVVLNNPLSDNSLVPANKVNNVTDMLPNTIDPSKRRLPLSIFVPPHMTFIFFTMNPSTVHPNHANQRYVVMGGGTLVTDSCRQDIQLGGGVRFIGGSGGCPISSNSNPASEGRTIGAPFLVVVQNREFSEVAMDMCIRGRTYRLGFSDSNRVWQPRESACDELMNTLCQSGTMPKSARACDCMRQQRQLNAKYGKDISVPVCCFGKDEETNDPNRACSFNPDAYKTADMLRQCCTFAQCQQLFNGNKQLQVQSGGTISCDGGQAKLPPSTTRSITRALQSMYAKPGDNARLTISAGHVIKAREDRDIWRQVDTTGAGLTGTTEQLPDWVWYVVISTVVLWVAYVLVLAWNTAPQTVAQTMSKSS